jgi:hypothetical protein
MLSLGAKEREDKNAHCFLLKCRKRIPKKRTRPMAVQRNSSETERNVGKYIDKSNIDIPQNCLLRGLPRQGVPLPEVTKEILRPMARSKLVLFCHR